MEVRVGWGRSSDQTEYFYVPTFRQSSRLHREPTGPGMGRESQDSQGSVPDEYQIHPRAIRAGDPPQWAQHLLGCIQHQHE